MRTRSGDFELTTDELRAVVRYGVACAQPALILFVKVSPDDPRPAAALEAAGVFADGAARSRLQRTAAAAAHRAAKQAPTEAARHAADAAGDAAAAAYLHPLAKATQVRHILGAAAHAARAAELARGEDPVIAEYVITAAAKRANPVVHDVLTRYPRAPRGRTRVAVLMQRLDSMLRDPAPTPRGATALGIAACHTGQRVLFATATDWVARLQDAHGHDRLRTELARLCRYGLIIIDEVGYLPFEQDAANLFFQLVSSRYEHASLILTSNLPFARWGDVFGDQTVAAAMIDRIVHHADVHTLKGASYRLKHLAENALPSVRLEQAD